MALNELQKYLTALTFFSHSFQKSVLTVLALNDLQKYEKCVYLSANDLINCEIIIVLSANDLQKRFNSLFLITALLRIIRALS